MQNDIGITLKSTWFMAHRIREAFTYKKPVLRGKVEVDEMYIGGKEKNKHKDKRLNRGRGSVGKIPVIGAKQRNGHVAAQVIKTTSKALTHGFVNENVEKGSQIYTDKARHWIKGIPGYEHDAVDHSIEEYVVGDVYTNWIESWFSLFKRAFKGTFHSLSEKHLDRYVQEFVCRENMRDMDTLDQMGFIIENMDGKRLTYKKLLAG
jgi:transposase-like protein